MRILCIRDNGELGRLLPKTRTCIYSFYEILLFQVFRAMGLMPSMHSKQTNLDGSRLRRELGRSISAAYPRILGNVLIALTFFLGLTLSVPIVQSGHIGESGKSFTLFPTTWANNGKGKGNGNSNGNANANANGNGTGRGNANGLGNSSSGATNYGQQKKLVDDLPLPPGLQDNVNSVPVASPAAHARSLNPINQIPDFKMDDEELLGNATLGLDGLEASEVDYLQDYAVPGLALGKEKQANGEIAVKANRPQGNNELSAPGQEVKAEKKKADVPPRAISKDNSAPSYSANEVLAENLSANELERVRALGFTVEEEKDGAVTRLVVPSEMTALDAATLLQRELPDSSFHLNRIYRIYHPAANEADTNEIEHEGPDKTPCAKDRCYGRQAIQWQDNFGKCASRLKIGIIDTHVDVRHKTFAGQRILQQTFMPDGRQLAESGHGTAVLAILAGRPDSITPGLVSEADFFVASIFFVGDDGSIQTDTVSLLKALHWMDRSGVQLVNMSFSGPKDPLVEARFDRLRNSGMAFTAAAGNEGLAADPSYPAAYSQIIAVTAVDKKMQIYPSANRGDYIDLAAPGVHIWTAMPDSKAGYVSGTSFAAPYMTAMLAIQRPEALQMSKDRLLDQVKTVSLEPGERSRTYGRGLLQAPVACPNAPVIATDRAPVTAVSLR
jgi:hypothetical protein